MPASCRSMYKGGDGLVPIPQANRFGYTAHLRRIIATVGCLLAGNCIALQPMTCNHTFAR